MKRGHEMDRSLIIALSVTALIAIVIIYLSQVPAPDTVTTPPSATETTPPSTP
jgi:hypothetical protein